MTDKKKVKFKHIVSQSTVDELKRAGIDLQEGIPSPLPIEVEVGSVEECAKADIMVCALYTPTDAEIIQKAVPGSSIDHYCQFCNSQLIIAPAGQKLLALGAKPTCVKCAVKHMQMLQSGADA